MSTQNLIFENGCIISFFQNIIHEFCSLFVEQNSFIWKGMKGLGFVISVSNFSAPMATFKTFCKLANVKKIVFRLNFLLKSFNVKKDHVHQVGLIIILHPY